MIHGERIRFRRLDSEDLPLFVAWLNEPQVRRGISMFLPLSQYEETSWYESMLQRPVEERPFSIDIPEGDGWRLIGSTSFFDFDRRNRSAEFGLLIGDKSVWNQGYGTEATLLMLQHGFDTLNLHRILLRVFETNPSARRVYEKAGFRHEGTLREAEFAEGRYIDIHLMSILESEWAARRPGA